MIYKLDQLYLTEAEAQNLEFICMSTTGLYFLVRGVLPENIESLDSFEESILQTLLLEEEWIQPSED